MKRPPAPTTWLALASATSLIGGILWLVLLLRADAAVAPVSVRLPTGETITVEYDSTAARAFSRAERRAIEDGAARVFPDVRRVLPELPPTLVLRMATASSKDVVPETGEAGTNAFPDIVFWSIDASRPEGVGTIVRTYLRQALFHELAHLARAYAVGGSGNLRHHVMQEGVATAIERDYGGGAPPLWGQYPPNVSSWAKELLALPEAAPGGPWFVKRSEGGSWVGSKVGTYLVDCAAKASGKTSAALVRVPTDTLIAMAIEACPAHGAVVPDSGDRTQ